MPRTSVPASGSEMAKAPNTSARNSRGHPGRGHRLLGVLGEQVGVQPPDAQAESDRPRVGGHQFGGLVGQVEVGQVDPAADEIDLLSTIAGQIASALTNARLYEEAKKIADQLYKSARDYRNLFENAHDAIWFHDIDGKILAANKASQDLTGYPIEEFLGRNVKEFMEDSMLKLAREVRHKLLYGEPLNQPYEQQTITKDGVRKTCMVTSSLMTVDNNPVGFQHIARDVTEERRMQTNLRYYLNQITRTQEEERKRIARELHDDTAQALFAISRQMDNFVQG